MTERLNQKLPTNLPLLVLGLLAIAGVGLILYITRWGIGTSPDSVAYISGARTLLAGQGLTNAYGEAVGQPMTFRAPFYSLLLAATGLLGADPLLGARWLNALLFGVNLLLLGLLILSLTRRANWLPVWGGLLLFSSLAMLNLHAYAWTEPLFITLAFTGFWLLAAYLGDGRWWQLLLAAFCMGLAVLTRYAGLPLVASGGLGILLFASGRWSRRLIDGLIFGLVSLLPFALWSGRNALVAGSSSGRTVAFHPVGLTHLWQAVYTVSDWLQLPSFLPGWVRLTAVFLLVGGSVWLLVWVARRQTAVPVLVKLLALFILVYVAFLLVSISFFDANTPLDDRILSPVFFAGVVLAAYALSVLGRQWSVPHWAMVLGLCLFGLWLATAVSRSARWTAVQHSQGLGFTSLTWQQSELLPQVARLPANVPVYSNAPEAIYLHTGRAALSLPRKFNATTQQMADDYPAHIAAIQAQLSESEAVIVLFSSLRPEAAETVAGIGQGVTLAIQLQSADGAIYATDTADVDSAFSK